MTTRMTCRSWSVSAPQGDARRSYRTAAARRRCIDAPGGAILATMWLPPCVDREAQRTPIDRRLTKNLTDRERLRSAARVLRNDA